MRPRVHIVGLCVLAVLLTGCAAGEKNQTSSSGGIGAMASGDESETVLIGEGVGGGVGYVIGNDNDRQKAALLSEQSANAAHDEVGPLGGTRWRVLDLQPRGRVPRFSRKILEFESDGHLVTTTTDDSGRTEVTTENYRVVGKTVIVNKPGYLVNATYWFDGDRLIVDGKDFRAVLLRATQ